MQNFIVSVPYTYYIPHTRLALCSYTLVWSIHVYIYLHIQTYLSQIYVDAIIDGAMLLTKYSFLTFNFLLKILYFGKLIFLYFFVPITFWRHYLYNEQRI